MNTNNEVTNEQNERTQKLKEYALHTILTVWVIAVVLLFFGCTPKRGEIKTYWGNTPAQAQEASKLHARDIGGFYSVILPTGSMEPTLSGGDWIVYVKQPYANVRVGMMAIYQARWRAPTDPEVCHWVSAPLGKEWIMDGEANAHYENTQKMLMGEKEFFGEVVAIYKVKEKP